MKYEFHVGDYLVLMSVFVAWCVWDIMEVII